MMHRYAFEHSNVANYDCALNSMKWELIARNVAHEKQINFRRNPIKW